MIHVLIYQKYECYNEIKILESLNSLFNVTPSISWFDIIKQKFWNHQIYYSIYRIHQFYLSNINLKKIDI